jgi:Spy/CpxP family protein refolding chaperone
MRWLTKARVKYTLAGVGAVYILLFIGYLVYAGVMRTAPQGPSELEANPERQDEILAQRRADELRQQLKLSEEQTQRLADIFQKNQSSNPPGAGDFRERWRAAQAEIAQVLTPEQQALMDQMRGQFAGPGGPRGRITPERIEALKQKMTPEQRARFEKRWQQWQQRRGQRGGPRGQGRPPQR